VGEILSNLGLSDFLTSDRVLGLARAVLIFVVGLVLARVVSRAAARGLRRRVSAQEAVLVRRLIFYVLSALVVTSALHQLGFRLGVLLGTAGVITVAVGFAAQTSLSNIISGFFLIAERPFEVGDRLDVNGRVGFVISIDLLSVKLRTFDNLMVRVPNAEMINTTFVNLTRFPIRRIDLQIGVAYKENTERVREILLDVAERNHLCLEEPPPLFIYKGYGDSALELQFSVWAKRDNFLELRNTINQEIKFAFDEHGIEIPFPHRTLYTGSVTEPFPVRVVTGDARSAAQSEQLERHE
jgi:small-conductance mechanosensitive channel